MSWKKRGVRHYRVTATATTPVAAAPTPPTFKQRVQAVTTKLRRAAYAFNERTEWLDRIAETLVLVGLQNRSVLRFGVGVRAVKGAVDLFSLSLEEHLQSFPVWRTSDYASAIWGFVRPHARHAESDDDGDIYVVERDGVRLMFAEESRRRSTHENDVTVVCYIVDGTDEEATRLLVSLVWESSKSICLVGQEHTDNFRIVEDDHFIPRVSVAAEELSERLRKFSNVSEPRTYIFRGPPGSGKTSAIAWLASTHGTRTLRLPMQTLGSAWHYLIPTLKMLRPDVLAIDDIDRNAEATRYLLVEFDDIRRYVPLVLLSVNSVKKIDKAFKRPGRVDEIVEIREQPDVVDKILEGISSRRTAPLRKLPVAYAAEFRARATALGSAQALKELPELLRRAKEAEEDDFDDDSDLEE